MRQRSLKKLKLINKYQAKRQELKGKIKKEIDPSVIYQLQIELAKLPLNSNPVRYSTRCEQCGRPHAVYKKFGLCRICLRQQLMTGNVTGGRKSSW